MDNHDASIEMPKLNRSQRHFCNMSASRNIRLLAPAGCGKTFSLLWRCKFITDEYRNKGKPLPYFLIVTFTRSARFELEQRIQSNPDFQEINAKISTLNAWGWDFLKSKTGKELISTDYQRKNLILHDLLPLCQAYGSVRSLLRQTSDQAEYAPLLIDWIDLMKSLGFTHMMNKTDFRTHCKWLQEIGLYDQYKGTISQLLPINCESKSSNVSSAEWEFFCFWKEVVVQLEAINRYTMEDQKYWSRVILEERLKAGKYTQSSMCYTHILIDEFQDINPLDLSLIRAISVYHGQGRPLCTTIVGDDDQAIFGWRATSPSFILSPARYFGFPFATAILDTSYRCPERILEAAGELISHNQNRVPKLMKTRVKQSAIIQVRTEQQGYASYRSTVQLVHTLLEKKGYSNVALISRKQASLFPYQVLFSSENTSYHVAEDLDIFEGEAMRSLQELIKIIYRGRLDDNDDPVDDLLTLCDKVYKYRLPPKDRQTLRKYLNDRHPENLEDAINALVGYPGTVKTRPIDTIASAVSNLFEADSVQTFMDVILEQFHGFDKNYKKADQDTHYKNPQFCRLKDLSPNYGNNLRRFNKDIDKARKNGEYCRERIADESGEGYNASSEIKLHLLTATRSKGCEFDAVIIIDCSDDEWPAQLSDNEEEERRLFYVAMTRAKRALYFIVPENHSSYFVKEAGIQ